ncbi:MAG: NAD(P)/FAD-dependent oxidoreductase [Lishizhenia sp.]
MKKKSIAVIGGGASALLFCCFIDTNKYDVTLYERNHAVGRKLLVAGKGGFNLSHAEEITSFLQRYESDNTIKKAIETFSNTDLQTFLKSIDIPTFAGSSNRIYPKEGIKPVEVLNAILKKIEENKVSIITKTKWKGWKPNGKLYFEDGAVLHCDITVFALGGGSWKVTGSDGGWLPTFAEKGIETKGFEASNCAFKVEWPEQFIQKNEGKPFKNISTSCNNKCQTGELVITKFGLEGNGIYGLSTAIRKQIKQYKKATVFIDFKPTLTAETLKEKIESSSYSSLSDKIRNDLKITKAQVNLLKTKLTREEYTNVNSLIDFIKAYPIEIIGLAPIDEAISTAGGIAEIELTDSFELKKLPNQYCIGEMLDYDCPTGGYLLQSCFSMGVSLAQNLNKQ